MNITDKLEAGKSVFRMHLEQAREADRVGDWAKARHEYRRSFSILENNDISNAELFLEYDNFVKRDPHFKEIADIFIAGITDTPGIRLSDIFIMDITKDWGTKYGAGQSIEPIDKKYFFDFAERFGLIAMKNEGKGKLIFVVDLQEE